MRLRKVVTDRRFMCFLAFISREVEEDTGLLESQCTFFEEVGGGGEGGGAWEGVRHFPSHQLSPIPTEALVSGLHFCLNTSSLNTPPKTALTHPTSPLIRDTPFDKSNFSCPMGSSPNPSRTFMFLLSRTSWPVTPCSTHSPFALQISAIPNHVVCATNSGYTKQRAHILAPGPMRVPNHVHTLDQSTSTSFHKRTP